MVNVLVQEESYDVISKNYEYYNTFTKYDWKARKVRNYDEYMLKVLPSVCNFSKTELKKLGKAVERANRMIDMLSEKYENGWGWLGWKKLKRLKWVLGCIKGCQYEGGFPHTVKNVIMVTKDILKTYDITSLACLLIHEKIHIYQRYYVSDAKKYIKLNNFKIYRKKRKNDLFRANPDLDKYVYERRGEIYSLSYVSDAYPLNISRVVNEYGKKITRKEHPYEEMAYFVEKMCRKCKM